MSTLGLAVLLINRSAGPPSLMTQRVVTNAFGDGTYTVWVSSCGLSACSGNTGCGGSPMGTQPRDLLMAWLSFLAGDFYGEGGRKEKRPSPRVRIVGKQFRELTSDVNLHNWVNCLFTVSKVCISSRLVQIQWVLVSAASEKYNARSPSFCVHVIWRVCCVRVQNAEHQQQQHMHLTVIILEAI